MCLYSVPAVAQETYDLKDRMSFFVVPDGKVMRMTTPVGTKGHTQLMKSGRESFFFGCRFFVCRLQRVPRR
jgi:hypothetical protein